MRKKFIFFSLLFIAFTMLSCSNDSDELVSEITIGNIKTTINEFKCIITDYQKPVTNTGYYNLIVTGENNIIGCFLLVNNREEKLPTGTYTFSTEHEQKTFFAIIGNKEEFEPNKKSMARAIKDISDDDIEYILDAKEIVEGQIHVSATEDIYTIIFEGTDEEQRKVRFVYQGKLPTEIQQL